MARGSPARWRVLPPVMGWRGMCGLDEPRRAGLFPDGATPRLSLAGDTLAFTEPPPVDHCGIGMAACNLSR